MKSINFLGITICQSKTFKCDWDAAKRKFYCNSNVILGRLGTSASAAVLLKLIHSQGVQNLLHGISATSLTKAELKSFSYAYNSFFAKIFKCVDNKIIMSCEFFSKYLCFEMLYEMYRYLFLSKLLNTGCLDKKNNLDKPDYQDYISLKAKYNFNEWDSIGKVKIKVWNHFENLVQQDCVV